MFKFAARFLPLVLLGQLIGGGAIAQQRDRTPDLRLGDAVVTGFSGITAPAPGARLPANKSAIDLTFINPDGPSARIVDVSKPGIVWDGTVLPAPKPFDVLAKDVGQVFGVALDDAPQPNIYLAATSAFGLNIVARATNGQPERRKKGGPGVGWMKGQFGLDLQGGPGAIYKIDGRTGVPTLFANVTLDGVPNPAAGLGSLVYDATHKQLLVSDLYTGMIHRFDLDGKELDRYDHGVTGLTAAKLAPVAFDARNRPNIGNDRFDSEKPETWGFAPAARRVWGLALHEGRLYYSVTSGPQIWSVGLAQDGRFANDPRWELDVPAQAGVLPISDIVFSNKGAMILAQRALIAGSYDYSAFTRPGEPQVFRVWLKGPQDPPSPGRWKLVPEEYAVGFAGNYRNTNGGIALGYGYGRDGNLSDTACEFSLWTTGQNLRNAPALRSRLDPGGALVVHGIQGLPSSPVRDINTPPWLSYTVGYGDRADNPRAAGHLGSLRVYSKPCAEPAVYSGPGYPANPPYIVTTSVVGPPPACIRGVDCPPDCIVGVNCPPTPARIDIGIAKIGEVNLANPNGPYNFTIGVRNLADPIATAMPLTFTDVVPAGMTFTSVTPTNYTCLPVAPLSSGSTLTCTYNGPFPIATNQVIGSVAIVADGGNGPYTNCASLGQSDGVPSNDRACATVQKDYGNVTVVKGIENNTQPRLSTTGLVFPVAVTCGGNVTNLSLIDGMPQTVGPIPFGTTCSVQEGVKPVPTGSCSNGQPPQWALETYSPPNQQVQITSGTNATISVLNKLECPPGGGNNGYVLYKKQVVSQLMGYAAPPLTFPVNVTCNGVTTSLTLPSNGTPQMVGGLAIGTSCQVIEPAPTNNACPTGMTTVWGTTNYSSSTANAAMPGPTVTVTNTFNCLPGGGGNGGQLEVKKLVVNTDPLRLTYTGTFNISVSCQLGTSPAVVTPVTLANGGSQIINNIALNSLCKATELTPLPPLTGTCTIPGQVPTWTVDYLPQDTETIGNTLKTINVRNTLECKGGSGGQLGTLTVTKTLTNLTQGQLSTTGMTYPISVSCSAGSSPAVVTNLSLIENVPQTVSNIALNSNCTVTETTPMPTPTGTCATVGAVATWTLPPAITPASPVSVNGTPVSVTVRNTLECKSGSGGGTGTLEVKKVLTNRTSPHVAISSTIQFAISTSCQLGTSPAVVTPMPLLDGGAQTISGLAYNTKCDITEVPPAPPALGPAGCITPGYVPVWTTVLPPQVTISAPTTMVIVQNFLDCVPAGGGSGTLVLTKVVNNKTFGGAVTTGLTYPTSVSCSSGMSPAVVTGVSLTESAPQTVSNIALNSSCTIVETPPTVTGTCASSSEVPTWSMPPLFSVPVPVPVNGGTVNVTVTNTLECKPGAPSTGYMRVTKTIDAGNTNLTPAALNNLVFPVTVTCSGAVTSLNVQLTVPGIVSGIPAPASCAVAEGTPPVVTGGCPAGQSATWTFPPAYLPADATANITTGMGPVVQIRNTLSCKPTGGGLGSLVLTKVVNNQTDGAASTTGLTYPAVVTCSSGMSPGVVTNVSLTESGPQTVNNIALGSTCQIVETPPAVTGVCADSTKTPTWVTSMSPVSPVPVNGANVPVTVTNSLECLRSGGGGGGIGGNGLGGIASLVVTKNVTNNTTGTVTNTSYAVNVSCQLGSGSPVITPLTLLPNAAQTVPGIAAGSNCTVTETEILQLPPGNPCAGTGPGRPSPVWTTNVTPSPATVNGPNTPVTVQNTLDCVPVTNNPTRGYVLIRKIVQNNAGADLASTSFPITVTCGNTAANVNLTSPTLATSVFNMLVGATCSAVETLPPPPATGSNCSQGQVPTWANSPAYSEASVTVVDGQGPTLTVTNTLNCATKQNIQVVVPLQCTPPLVPNNAGTGCGCPSGMVLIAGKGCTAPPPPPPACSAPMIPGAVKGQCICPQGTVQSGRDCVKQNACKAPMVAGAVPGQCVCPAGTTKRGERCVATVVCRAPAKLNGSGTACTCPQGMTLKGNTCVEPERKRPAVTPGDVIRVVPGLIGPGGFGGGGGGSSGGDKGGGGGGYKPPGVR